MTDNTFPIPTTISEKAQEWLAFQNPEIRFPPRDDTDAWLALVEQSDQFIIGQFLGRELPVTTEEQRIGDVPVHVARPRGVDDDPEGPLYINFHGGALIFGGGETCRFMSGMAALTSGLTTWGVDYRMPPLHPYPAALDDAVAVYRAALEVRGASRVLVGGGSAGGNIAAALVLRARDEGLPMPAALVLNTPEVDLTESGDTFETNRGADNVLRSLREVNLLYAGDNDLTDPYLSPIFGDVTGFPPTFLTSGTRDLFLSNTVRMHRKLRAAGVEAELHVGEAMPHGGFGGSTPEDQELAAEQRLFLNKHTPK